MSILDFPASPTDGQLFNAPNGVTYLWSAAKQFWRGASGVVPSPYLPLAGGTLTGPVHQTVPPPASDNSDLVPTTSFVRTALANAIPAGVVSLAQFITSSNPLQAALAYLGSNGGTIRIPNQRFDIPGPAVSAANLRSLGLIGEGPDSCLNFTNGGGGIALTFGTPSGNEMQRDQLHVERLSITTSFPVSSSSPTGGGTALAASWALAVGDVTLGATLRDVQVGETNKYPDGSGNISWWDTCLQFYNCRELTLSNVYTWADHDDNIARGVGIDLNGGTVQVQLSDVNCSMHNIGVWTNGYCEGIQWDKGVTIGCNIGASFDGDVIGRARGTSSTPFAIGTGSKTFAVDQKIGAPDGLSWLYGAGTLMVRSQANPLANWMFGTITATTGPPTNSVTLNITSFGGSGTFSDWTISAEHHISQVALGKIHSSNNSRNWLFRWTTFVNASDLMMQMRDVGTAPFWHFEFLQEAQVVFLNDITLSSLNPTSQQKNGIALRGSATSYNRPGNNAGNIFYQINNITFTEAAFTDGVLVEQGCSNVRIGNLMPLGTFAGKIIDNQTVGTYQIIALDSKSEVDNFTWVPLATNAATPSVAMDGVNKWRTNNSSPTSITNFLNGAVGQKFDVMVNDTNTTFQNTVNLGFVAPGWSPPLGTVLSFLVESSTYCRLVSYASGQLAAASVLLNTGANTPIILGQDASNAAYNIVSLNGSTTEGSFVGMLGGQAGDPSLYFNTPASGSYLWSVGGTRTLYHDPHELSPLVTNTTALGNSTHLYSVVWAVNGTIQTSDIRLKTGIEPLPDVAGVFDEIRPITYSWRDGNDGRTHWGFDAAEIRDAFARTGKDFGGYVQGDEGTDHLRPDELIAVLWKRVQELSAEVAAMKEH